jgi:hypothetical protein
MRVRLRVRESVSSSENNNAVVTSVRDTHACFLPRVRRHLRVHVRVMTGRVLYVRVYVKVAGIII